MADKKISELDAVSSAARTDEFVVVQSGTTKRAALSDIDAVAEIGASQVTAGTLADARVAESNVTQHEAALSVAGSQVDSGTLPDARIQESGVTQHGTAALEVPWSNTVVVEGDNSTRTTRAAAVQAAITEAAGASKSFVFVPHEFLNYDASAVTFDNSVRMVREGQVGDVFDVKAYGAAGDGAVDDHRAIQDTINVALFDSDTQLGGGPTTGTVYFPHGDYRVTAEITFNGPVLFQGANKVDSRILGDHGNAVFRSSVQGTEAVFHPAWRDLSINQLSGGTQPLLGIDLRGISFADVFRCRIRNMSSAGIRIRASIGGGFYNAIRECEIASNNIGINFQSGANSNRVTGGRINGNTTGISLDSCNDVYIRTALEANGVGIDFVSGAVRCMVMQCRFEGQTTQGLRFNAGAQENIVLGGEFSNAADVIDDQDGGNIILVSDDGITAPFSPNGEIRRKDSNRELLAADKVLALTDPTFQSLDPGGANRNVDLPAETSGREFVVANRADAAEDLVVRDDAAATLLTLNQGDVGRFYSDGTGWIGFKAAGVVT